MPLPPKADLAAAQLAFYSLSFLFSLAVCARQRLRLDFSWLYLVLLSILRIIGAACVLSIATLYASTSPSSTLELVAAVTSAAGTAPLLLLLLGTLSRLQAGLFARAVPRPVFYAMHGLAAVGMALAVYGGVAEAENGGASAAAKSGKICLATGSLVFLVVFLACAGIAGRTLWFRDAVLREERRLMHVDAMVLPFLLVRVVYTVCVGFAATGSKFWFEGVDVWVEAFMQFLMEAIVISLFVFAGLVTPRRERTQRPVKEYEVQDLQIAEASKAERNDTDQIL